MIRYWRSEAEKAWAMRRREEVLSVIYDSYLPKEYIKEIERAMGLKLYDSQKNMLTGKPPFYGFGNRRSGYTTAFCIKLALSHGEPIDLNRPFEFVDEAYGDNYDRWFIDELMGIRERLKVNGFKVRDVKKGSRLIP
jgi:hypothetical protein